MATSRRQQEEEHKYIAIMDKKCEHEGDIEKL